MLVIVALTLTLIIFSDGVKSSRESQRRIDEESNNFSNCDVENLKRGQWVRGAEKHCGTAAIYPHPLLEGATFPVDPNLPKPWPFSDWCWKPHECNLEKFSIKRFCEKLRGRSILVVGDSIQHQFYDSLFMQLDTPGQPMEQWYTENILDNPKSGSICENMGGGRLHYVRCDQVSVTNVVPWNTVQQRGSKRVTNRDWKHVAHVFDFIVLSKGPHYVPVGESEADSRRTASWLKNLVEKQKKENNRNVYVFYRTAPTGSPHCSVDSKPNTTLLLTEPEWLPVSSPQDIATYKHDYHWDTFPHVNKVTVDIFKEALPEGHFFPLHVAEMSVLRPDAHRCYQRGEMCDELHYFLPSVVDDWVHSFFHFLPEN